MRLSREKTVHLSHIISDYLEREPQVKVTSQKNDLRLFILDIFTKEMKKDAMIDTEVREKIRKMKSEIPEGSPDWEVLYFKLYQETLDKIRKAR